MLSQMKRISVIGIDGREVAVMSLCATSTVRDVLSGIEDATGTPMLTQRLVYRDTLLPLDASLSDALAEDDSQLTLVISSAIKEYRVLQGVLYKRPGANPSIPKVLKLHRSVGSKVLSTGRTWRGPAGGQWLELEPSTGKPGWLLVEGPGFDHIGPLLEEVVPGEDEPLTLFVRNPFDDEFYVDVCLKASQSVLHARHWICWRLPGLRPKKTAVVRRRWFDNGYNPDPSPGFMLPDEMLIGEIPLKNGDELKYIYTGDADEDMGETSTGLRGHCYASDSHKAFEPIVG